MSVALPPAVSMTIRWKQGRMQNTVQADQSGTLLATAEHRGAFSGKMHQNNFFTMDAGVTERAQINSLLDAAAGARDVANDASVPTHAAAMVDFTAKFADGTHVNSLAGDHVGPALKSVVDAAASVLDAHRGALANVLAHL